MPAAWGINSADYLVVDGVEQLLAFMRKRLHIRDIDLETDAFEHMSTAGCGKEDRPHEIQQC